VECGSVRIAFVIEKLEKQLRLALDEENELLEADFADVRGIITRFSICGAHFRLFVIVIEELRLAKRKHKHDADLIAALRRKVDDPDPTIGMGETGEEYSFEVFRFAAKCLVTGCTFSEIARLVDVFFFVFFLNAQELFGCQAGGNGKNGDARYSYMGVLEF
jgi:hypothetical protein